jgi:hypothetical protein
VEPPATVPDDARAPIVWDPAWARANAVDYAVIAASGSIALAAAIVPAQPKHSYGGVLFDESVRNALRPSSIQARYIARDTSDVLVSLTATSPVFIDAMITTWWYRKSRETAYEMAVIDAEAMAITAALQQVSTGVASRERPYGRDCGSGLPNEANDCTNPTRYRSFFSGHSSLSFTGAGLVCSHHLHLDLLGGGAPDVAACVGAYAAAAATATLRVVGDMHYATDVLTGFIVGTAVGLGVPAIHYARRTPSDATHPTTTGTLEVNVVPLPNGVSVGGVF